MTLILTILSLFNIDCLEMDIMLVIDYSGSVATNEPFIHEATSDFIERFEDKKGVRIGIILFNDAPDLVQELTFDHQKLRTAAMLMKKYYGNGGTDMTSALYTAGFELNMNRPKAHKVIILISDGAPNSRERAMTVSSEIKAQGMMMCGVFINSSVSNSEFMKATCEPCYMVTDYKELSEQLSQLNLCI